MTPSDMDVGTIVLWAAALSTLLNFSMTLWNAFSSPARRADQRISDLEKSLTAMVGTLTKGVDVIEHRVQRIEDRLTTIPVSRELHALELDLTKLRGEMAVLSGKLVPVAAMAERMQEWMLENGK